MEDYIVKNQPADTNYLHYFRCTAEDKAHAIEQCKNFNPGCEILDVGHIVWLGKEP